MALDDLVPDDKKKGSSSKGGGRTKQKPDTVTIGSEPYKKVFEQEKWQKVKTVLTNDMGLIPNEVVNNYRAEERYEVIHEAALVVEEDKSPEELDNYDEDRCAICDSALGDFGVELEGLEVCANHPAAQIKARLDED